MVTITVYRDTLKSAMKLADRLKELRKRKGISQYQVARDLNISRSTYTSWELGRTFPNDEEMLRKLAEYFGVSIDYLLGKTDDPTPPQKRLEDYPWYVELRPIPVYNGASAGDIGTFPDNREIVTWIMIPRKKPGKFGIIVHGDSMEPEIHDGDIVIVDPDLSIENGSKVVVIIDGEAFVKKIYFEDNAVILQSNNDKKYPPKVIPRRKINAFVVGKVIGWFRTE